MTTETADTAEPVVDLAHVYVDDVGRAFRDLVHRDPSPLDTPTAEEAEALLGMISGRLHFYARDMGWYETGRRANGNGFGVRGRELDRVLVMVLHARDWISWKGITQAGIDAANRLTGQSDQAVFTPRSHTPSLRQIADHIAGRTTP